MFRRFPRHDTRVALHRFIQLMFGAIRRAYPDDGTSEVIEFTIIASAIITAHEDDHRRTVNALAHQIGMPRSTLRGQVETFVAKGYLVRDELGRLDISETLLLQPQVDTAIITLRDAIIEFGERLATLRERGD